MHTHTSTKHSHTCTLTECAHFVITCRAQQHMALTHSAHMDHTSTLHLHAHTHTECTHFIGIDHTSTWHSYTHTCAHCTRCHHIRPAPTYGVHAHLLTHAHTLSTHTHFIVICRPHHHMASAHAHKCTRFAYITQSTADHGTPGHPRMHTHTPCTLCTGTHDCRQLACPGALPPSFPAPRAHQSG